MPRNDTYVLTCRRNQIVLIFSTRSLELSRDRDASVADSSIIRRAKSLLLFSVFPPVGWKFSGLIIEELTGPAVNWCKNSAAFVRT